VDIHEGGHGAVVNGHMDEVHLLDNDVHGDGAFVPYEKGEDDLHVPRDTLGRLDCDYLMMESFHRHFLSHVSWMVGCSCVTLCCF